MPLNDYARKPNEINRKKSNYFLKHTFKKQTKVLKASKKNEN